MKTLEHLAVWLLFSLSALMIYCLLSLSLIAPAHAMPTARPLVVLGTYDTLAACERARRGMVGQGLRCVGALNPKE